MCLILFAFQHHPDFPLIVSANRDEFYRRPTLPAHYWNEAPHIFAGKDLQAGGTWMGVTKTGRFAAVTNFRELSAPPEQAISRGALCSDFLNSNLHPEAYLKVIDQKKHRYSGFNLLLGDGQQLYNYSNRQGDIQALRPGIHGLSNGLLNENWPKVQRGKQTLEKTLTNSSSLQAILPILFNKQQAKPSELPTTGVDDDTEQLLSSRFIQSPEYGTRTSTVCRIDRASNCDWLEQHFDANGPLGDATLFQITSHQ